ncbi:MAG: dihydroxyacetone kinase subunit L [Methylotenera sp.]|nr:dihydroxyacetone kinase subunit L [Methylotenera sp.]
MKTSLILSATLAVRSAITKQRDDIDALDSALAGANHYAQLKRTVEEIASQYNTLILMREDQVFNQIGNQLSANLNDYSGLLLSNFFYGMEKFTHNHVIHNTQDIAKMLSFGVQTAMQRSKIKIGGKTLLDVLVPVSTTLTTMAGQGKSNTEICYALKDAADKGLEYTRDLQATQGQATSLGNRSIGHLDARAKSCQVIIHAICDLLLKQQS